MGLFCLLWSHAAAHIKLEHESDPDQIAPKSTVIRSRHIVGLKFTQRKVYGRYSNKKLSVIQKIEPNSKYMCDTVFTQVFGHLNSLPYLT